MALAANGIVNAAPYKWEYADAAARTGDTGFIAADEGKFARQLDDDTVWMLTDYTGPTWTAVSGTASGAAGGVLAGTYPNPSFAADMATQAELDAHTSATNNPHSTSDANLVTTDVTTNNASTAKHGFLKKLSNSATEYMDGTGAWSVPSGSGIPGTIVDVKGDLIVATAADTVARLAAGSNGMRLVADSAQTEGIKWAYDYSTLNFVIDGGGAAITTGVKGDLVVDFDCTIVGVTMLADQSGSIVVDIWKDTYANYPPVVGDSITASAKPTISAATKSQDTTLTGWTTSISAGQTLRFNVDSITTVQRVTLALKVRRS